MKQHKIILVVLLAAPVLALTPPSLSRPDSTGQRTARKPRTIKPESLRRIHKDALKRLGLLANNSKEIGEPAARVRVQARIADVLWQRDESHARQLFTQAYDDAINIRPPTGGGQDDGLSCGQVRSEIIRAISEHDPAMAAQLVLRDKGDTACSFGPRERNAYEDARSVMLVWVAFSIVTKDPVGAARLARETLSGGIVSRLPELIAKLKEADSGLATDLIDAAIKHIRSSDINGLELVSMGREILGEPELKGGKAILNKDRKVDALLATRLLGEPRSNCPIR